MLTIIDGAMDPESAIHLRNALINLAGLTFDTGDANGAVEAYRDILRRELACL